METAPVEFSGDASTHCQFAKFIVDFTEKWRKLIRAANIEPE
jgi:hypothetical protein